VPEPSPADRSPLADDPRLRACVEAYWRSNLRVMAVLLALWSFVGLG
jgi:hypothetical protein